MSLIRLIDFKIMGDGRGNLVSLEGMKNIPFDIKRVYYLTDLNLKHPRGFHAHKELEQVVVCLSGSCLFVLDNGNKKEEVRLQSSFVGLFIPKMYWREMYEFSDDCILMVIANHYYNEEDYIRNYDDFLERVSHA